MKKAILFLFMLSTIGCQQQPLPVIKKAEPKVEPKVEPKAEPKVEPKLIEKKSPVNPPNTTYLNGYNDGFYGTWLGPIRWVLADDYRTGWNAGHADKVAKLPHRYNP